MKKSHVINAEEMLKFSDISFQQRNMSYGCRCLDRTPLTKEEIAYLKNEIKAIKADESIFIFNDKEHITKSTCYDIENDVIYVTRNVFPDTKSFSTHPRDQMSPRAVLAHEYYRHRMARERYLKELSGQLEPIPLWKDEAFASANAALNTPNLNDRDRVFLLNDAYERAREASHEFKFTDEMKEIIYGHWKPNERKIVSIEQVISFYSIPSGKGGNVK